MEAAPTEEERTAVDELLGPAEAGREGGHRRTERDLRVVRGGHEARERRHLLLPALHALQSGVGWISRGGMNYVCQRLSVPPAEAYGVATFYAMFSVEERPGTVVHVCDDLACRGSGGGQLCDELTRDIGPEGIDGGGWTWQRSPCLGMCEQAPAIFAQRAGRTDVAVGRATHASVASVAAEDVTVGSPGTNGPTAAPAERERLRLLRRVGVVDPASIDDYRTHGGYESLRRAIELGPEAVIQAVTDAKLLGRGGAAFPTGVKWKAVSEQPAQPHVVICNADESEPGTFKDRIVMEQDPFSVVEALTVAGIACGAETGYLYIRGEYPLATQRLTHAIAEARRHGYLGQDVMGHGAAFDIELRRGAGAYICGEETALFNSIEGKRGEPRNKPPFPVQVGLFGKPTVVNNVETLVNVPALIREGGAAYGGIGTSGSTGPKLFCVSGDVARPGLYEAPFGITLRQLLELAGARPVRAVLLGGAAGVFVGPADLDVALTFEGTRAIGATLGSGVVMAFGESIDLVDIVRRIAEFFRDESCGQCVPCRVGTVRQEELLARLRARRPLGSDQDELALLKDLGQVMRDASICGLGQTASSAVESAIFRLAIAGSRS